MYLIGYNVIINPTWIQGLECKYNWPLNNAGVTGADPLAQCSKKIHVELLNPQNLTVVVPQYLQGVGCRTPPRQPLWIPKSAGAHFPYIKWQRKMHTVGPPTATDWKLLFPIHSWLNLWMQNAQIWRAGCIFIGEKSVYV